MIRAFFAAAISAGMLFVFSGCGDEPTKNDNGGTVIPPVRTYLAANAKVLYGDTLWIQWSAAVNGANAKVQLSSRKPNDSAWCGLSILERGDKSARVVVKNDSVNFLDLPPLYYAKMRVSEGASEEIIDSFYLRALIIDSLGKPHGGDTIATGDNVKIYWRLSPGMIDQLLFKVSPDNGNSESEIKQGQGTPITDAFFTWVVGGEDNPQTYTAGTPVYLKMTDYGDQYRDQWNLVYKP